ncbi:MAG: cytochrome c [Betaproteobacteria bacterium]|nr:cytochrome c [Betaproteobacteria bacterium]
MNRTIKTFALAALLAAFTAGVQASAMPKGNAAKGKEASAACAACHGEDGNSKSGEFPKLAGQHADYLYNSLVQYKSKQRKNAIMGGFAATLSRQQMADLAAFYASQKGLDHKY